MVDKQPARWIEFESKTPPTKEIKQGRIIVFKALIPEARLARHADPFGEITELIYSDTDWDFGKDPEDITPQRFRDPARIAYEIERFRKEFPFPPAKPPTETSPAEIKTPLKTYLATKINYPTQFTGKLFGGKGGRWGWKGNYSIWLSQQAPFGVVAVETVVKAEEEYATEDSNGVYQLNGHGVRMKLTSRLELSATGTNAKSAFMKASESLK